MSMLLCFELLRLISPALLQKDTSAKDDPTYRYAAAHSSHASREAEPPPRAGENARQHEGRAQDRLHHGKSKLMKLDSEGTLKVL